MRLDPDGFHVCKLVLFNHEGANNQDILHHRISVMAKKWQPAAETPEPVEFMLDMRAEEWERLQDVESFHKALVTIGNRVPQDTRSVGLQRLGRRTAQLFGSSYTPNT